MVEALRKKKNSAHAPEQHQETTTTYKPSSDKCMHQTQVESLQPMQAEKRCHTSGQRTALQQQQKWSQYCSSTCATATTTITRLIDGMEWKGAASWMVGTSVVMRTDTTGQSSCCSAALVVWVENRSSSSSSSRGLLQPEYIHSGGYSRESLFTRQKEFIDWELEALLAAD